MAGVYSHTQVAQAYGYKHHRHHPFLMVGGIMVAIVVVLIIVGAVYSQQSSATSCRDASCQPPPPVTPPLPAANSYTSTKYGFSLEYDQPQGSISEAVNTDSSIGWTDSGYPFTFSGQNAGGRTAEQIVGDMQQSQFPNATLAFTLPQAEMGYTPGYGGVYDYTVTPASGQAERDRVIIVAAVKHDIAVVLVSVGVYTPNTQHNFSHPNPASTSIVSDIDPILNSVRWKGDPPI